MYVIYFGHFHSWLLCLPLLLNPLLLSKFFFYFHVFFGGGNPLSLTGDCVHEQDGRLLKHGQLISGTTTGKNDSYCPANCQQFIRKGCGLLSSIPIPSGVLTASPRADKSRCCEFMSAAAMSRQSSLSIQLLTQPFDPGIRDVSLFPSDYFMFQLFSSVCNHRQLTC